MSILLSISNLVKQFIPSNLRGQERLEDFLQAPLAPMQDLVDEQVALEADSRYKVGIQFETIYIDTFLNDLLDDSLRRIYIETNEGADQTWKFNRIEQRVVGHAFSRWDDGVAYTANNKIIYQGRLYEAVVGSTNQTPYDNPVYWTDLGAADKIYLREEYSAEYSFTVWLPETFDASAAYSEGDVVFHEDVIYKCKDDIAAGAFDGADWSVYDTYLRNELARYIAAGNNYNIKTY